MFLSFYKNIVMVSFVIITPKIIGEEKDVWQREIGV